jgi:hypothetical protein
MADPRTTSIVGEGGGRAGGGGGSGGDTTRIVIRHGAFVFRKTIPSMVLIPAWEGPVVSVSVLSCIFKHICTRIYIVSAIDRTSMMTAHCNRKYFVRTYKSIQYACVAHIFPTQEDGFEPSPIGHAHVSAPRKSASKRFEQKTVVLTQTHNALRAQVQAVCSYQDFYGNAQTFHNFQQLIFLRFQHFCRFSPNLRFCFLPEDMINHAIT